MSDLAYVKLAADDIEARLRSIDGWIVQDDKLTKTYSFKAYKDGVVFASAVGYAADKLNHHPDITIGYGKVTVAVNTHDVGGISPYDFELARRIDQI
jgi:4a-hydroxytetrahydrobiopterin dehydratase